MGPGLFWGAAFGIIFSELTRNQSFASKCLLTASAIAGSTAIQCLGAEGLRGQSAEAPRLGLIAWVKSAVGIAEPKPLPLTKRGLSDSSSSAPRVLIIATGSVATVKIPEIVLGLREVIGPEVNVKVVATSSGSHMLRVSQAYNAKAFAQFDKLGIEVLTDEDEWLGYEDVRNDLVVHIELRRWADVAVIAPCSAHSLAKIANGFSDNLATSVIRAWDPMKPMIVAPAMNTVMWEHPATRLHLETLEEWGFTIVPPAVKKLACNDIGRGALAHVTAIMKEVKVSLKGYEERREGEGVGSWKIIGFDDWVDESQRGGSKVKVLR